MSNHDDFWTSLATGHTNTVLAGAMDSHLSGKSLDESFGSVRTLTDIHRQANALVLPVEAGTKVAFAGGLGAVMSYDDAPADGITGEVVTVKSATGDITHHDGKVFVKWADGKFRPIHAEHLRLASTGKTAMEHASEDALKKYLKEHPSADKSKHTVGKGNGKGGVKEALTALSGLKDLAIKGLDALREDPSAEAVTNVLRQVEDLWDKEDEGVADGEHTDRLDILGTALDALWKTLSKEDQKAWEARKTASGIKAQFEKIKAMAEKRPDSKFLKSILTQMADKGFAPTDKQMAVVKKIEDEIEQQGEMKKELKGLDKKGGRKVFHYEDFGSTIEFAEELGWKDVYGDGDDDDYDGDAIEEEALDYIKRKGYRVKMSGFDASTIGERKGKPIQMDDEDKDTVGNFGQGEHHDMTDAARGKKATFRVASLGDLTDFLKVASGALVHKSTKDLWSYSKDADGNFLVSRLFDDEGEPLKV